MVEIVSLKFKNESNYIRVQLTILTLDTYMRRGFSRKKITFRLNDIINNIINDISAKVEQSKGQ